MASLPRTTLFEAISKHDPQSLAVIHSLSGRRFTYGSLLQDVAVAKQKLAKDVGRDGASLRGERIAFLVENSYDYVGAQSLGGNTPNQKKKKKRRIPHRQSLCTELFRLQ